MPSLRNLSRGCHVYSYLENPNSQSVIYLSQGSMSTLSGQVISKTLLLSASPEGLHLLIWQPHLFARQIRLALYFLEPLFPRKPCLSSLGTSVRNPHLRAQSYLS